MTCIELAVILLSIFLAVGGAIDGFNAVHDGWLRYLYGFLGGGFGLFTPYVLVMTIVGFLTAYHWAYIRLSSSSKLLRRASNISHSQFVPTLLEFRRRRMDIDPYRIRLLAELENEDFVTRISAWHALQILFPAEAALHPSYRPIRDSSQQATIQPLPKPPPQNPYAGTAALYLVSGGAMFLPAALFLERLPVICAIFLVLALAGFVGARYFEKKGKRFLSRIASNQCANCGYNLTGNLSGNCPECGTPIKRHEPSSH